MLANALYLTFHGIGSPVVPPAEGELKYFVSADVFRKTVAMLADLEVARGIKTHVTFDDGNLSDYEVGFPTLLDHRRSGTFFVIAGRIGQKGYLSAAQIREMADAGMRIGTHGHDHVDWRRLDAAGRQRELVDARRRIEDVVGSAVGFASVPFGGFDRPLLKTLKSLGYERVFTSSTGLAYGSHWFCPRRSLTDVFDPATDLDGLVGAQARVRALAYRVARRFRYGV